MTTVFISPAWPVQRAHNGVVTYITHLLGPLREQGVDVRLLAQWVDEDLLADAAEAGVATVQTERNNLSHYLTNKVRRSLDAENADTHHKAWLLERAMKRLHRETPVDLYEIEEAFGHGRVLLGRLPGKQVIRLHGPWFLQIPALGLDRNALDNIKRVEREGDAIRTTDGLSAPSARVLDQVRERYGLALPNAAVIPNATPLVDRVWSRAEATPNSILFVGRFDAVKGADTIIAAFARLHARRPETTLTFVGPDRGMPDGTGIEEFARRTLSPAARGCFRWLGAQTPAQIAELRPKAAVTVVPSRFETFGMTVIEAMAAGCPVLGSRGGAIPELLGWADELQFDVGDVHQLAQKLEWFFDHPAAAQKLAAAGRERCAVAYAPDAVARATAAFHDRVCSP